MQTSPLSFLVTFILKSQSGSCTLTPACPAARTFASFLHNKMDWNEDDGVSRSVLPCAVRLPFLLVETSLAYFVLMISWFLFLLYMNLLAIV